MWRCTFCHDISFTRSLGGQRTNGVCLGQCGHPFALALSSSQPANVNRRAYLGEDATLDGASSKKWVRQSSNYQRQLGIARMGFAADVDEHHAVRAYQFLWIDYRCDNYYFEVVDVGRRILLTACLAVIALDRPLQLVIGFIMSTVFTLYTANSRPFAQSDDSTVSVVTQLSTTCSFFVFLLLRVSVSGWTKEIQRHRNHVCRYSTFLHHIRTPVVLLVLFDAENTSSRRGKRQCLRFLSFGDEL